MSETFASTENLIGNLREIRFTIEVGDETVPGLAYLPTETETPMPLVLIQHPGTSSKDDYFVADVAKMWAPRGWVCAGIDAPLHGERRGHDPMSLFRDSSLFPEIVAQFAREVSATIDALKERLPIDPARIGYVGYSMGSMLGVPAVAMDGRFKAAAFCLVGEGGMVGPATGPESYLPRLVNVAVRIVGKKSDELVGRAATEALYEALPGEKDIVWLSGGHFQIGPDVVAAAGDWLKAHL